RRLFALAAATYSGHTLAWRPTLCLAAATAIAAGTSAAPHAAPHVAAASTRAPGSVRARGGGGGQRAHLVVGHLIKLVCVLLEPAPRRRRITARVTRALPPPRIATTRTGRRTGRGWRRGRRRSGSCG